ncbi:MAG TPA: hypothetical protein PLR30_08765, partial [Saprospiraceae bacterium]|nr:hypothetical protein [Saprospiraceae bacterium]
KLQKKMGLLMGGFFFEQGARGKEQGARGVSGDRLCFNSITNSQQGRKSEKCSPDEMSNG